MAIKLESIVKGIECLSLLNIESPTDTPAISLKVDEAASFVGEKWTVDPTKGKQWITFIGEDGPVELQGIVDQDKAIDIAAAWKVIVEVRLSTQALPAFEAGRKSKTLLALSVLRVTEVWATSKKCLWRASDASGAARGGAVFDPSTGRIEGKAA